jgi:hypothetical protein
MLWAINYLGTVGKVDIDGPVPPLDSCRKLVMLDEWHFKAVEIQSTYEEEPDMLFPLCSERNCSRNLSY